MNSWTRELARPLPLCATIALAVNDHVLKGAHVLPGWLTGKLSDFAGLFVFPILLFALSRAVLGAPRNRVARASIFAMSTALVFAAIKVVPAANALANRIMGDVALDPTDLVALPMVVLAVLYLRRAPAFAAPRGEIARRVAVLFTAVSCVATSAPRYERNYPKWEVRGVARDRFACSEIAVEIVTSGKTGLGAVVTRSADDCGVRVVAARVRIDGVAYPAANVPAWDEARSLYLGFPFDNEGLWNDGKREGTLEIDVSSAEQRATLVFSILHTWTGPQRQRVYHAPSPPPPPSSLPLAVPPQGGDP